MIQIALRTTAVLTAATLTVAGLAGCSRETRDGLPPPTAQQDPSFGQSGLNTESRGLPQTPVNNRQPAEPGRTPPPAGGQPLPAP